MLTSRLFISALILFGGYLFFDYLIPNADLILAERVLQAATSVVVMYVYWPDAVTAVGAREPEKGDYLILGITLGFFATACQAVFSVVFRLAGNPWWLANADFVGIWIAMSILAGVLHLLAPGVIGGTVPRRNRIAMGVGLGASVVLALFLLVARPDVAPYVEKMRPYLGDWFNTGTLKGQETPPA